MEPDERERGRVLPSTLDKVSLEAVHDDGTKTTGEVNISKSGKRIRRLNPRPSPGAPTHEVLEAVTGDFVCTETYARHDPGKLARAIMGIISGER